MPRDLHVMNVPSGCISARGRHATRQIPRVDWWTSAVSWVNERCEDSMQLNYSATFVALRKREDDCYPSPSSEIHFFLV